MQYLGAAPLVYGVLEVTCQYLGAAPLAYGVLAYVLFEGRYE